MHKCFLLFLWVLTNIIFFALFPRFSCRIEALGALIAALPCPADGQIFVGKSYKPKVNF